MSRRFAILLALATCAPLAQAQHATLVVSATVVDTCHFGTQARCRTPATRLEFAPDRAVVDGTRTLRQRVVHL